MTDAELHDTILVADLGGTNVRFALAEPARLDPLREDSVRRYRVAGFSSLAEAARCYLDDTGATPTHAVFAVAGRVDAGEVRITNLPWTVSATATRQALGFASVRLLNDFAALGIGLPLLTPGDLCTIGTPQAAPFEAGRDRTVAVVGPGTGLGVAALLVRDGRSIVLETEGGHASFAPNTSEQCEVLRILAARFGHVSKERMICGAGLVNLYRALCEIAGTVSLELEPEDITARVGDSLCVRAVEMFCDMLGAIAGDLVLSFGAWDGVYLAGGLLEPLLPRLAASSFRASFEAKGRFEAALGGVSTVVITHPHAGLLGAAAAAVGVGGKFLR